ncbi:hypothetical protein CDIK_1220 [Cucumispora dikerogammari]|nr:hypothetical protein CDIK_1220 [Cucumispora dikerogammari]
MSSELLDLSNFEYENIINLLTKPNKSKLNRQLIKTLIKLIKINFNVLPISEKEKLLIKKKEILIWKKLELAKFKHNMIIKFRILKLKEYKDAVEQVCKIREIMAKPIKCELKYTNNLSAPIFPAVEAFVNTVNKIENFLENRNKVAVEDRTSYEQALQYLKGR